ncbi:MAG: HYC_CC_PP family protein [Sphingomonadales bacterium]
MSRVLLSISMLGLVALSSGLTLNVHFCMNQVQTVSLFATDEHQCDSCGMQQEESGGCCHQERQLVKLVQDQCPPHFLQFNIAPASAYVLPIQTILAAQEDRLLVFVGHQVLHPPDIVSTPLFLRNRVFRI